MERKEIHELEQPCTRVTQLTHHGEIHGTRRQVPQDKIYNQALTPWRRVNKSPPSPFKTKTIMKILKIMKGAQGLLRMSRPG
jgi:hypothetical protein